MIRSAKATWSLFPNAACSSEGHATCLPRGPDLAAALPWRERRRGAAGGACPGGPEFLLTATPARAPRPTQLQSRRRTCPGTSYFGDTRVGVDLLRETDEAFRPRPRHRPARALGASRTSSSPSPLRPAASLRPGIANAAFDIDVSARSRRVERDDLESEDFFIDPDVRVPPGDPGALPEDVTRIERQHLRAAPPTSTLASSSGPTRRARSTSGSRPPTSTTPATAPRTSSPRSAAELAGALAAAPQPGVLVRWCSATTATRIRPRI